MISDERLKTLATTIMMNCEQVAVTGSTSMQRLLNIEQCAAEILQGLNDDKEGEKK